jgi:polyisoprenyl-teichoic acid--peptidoglycan teichoic acid transferase
MPSRFFERFARRIAIALVLVVTIVIASVVLLNVAIDSKLKGAKRVHLTLADTPAGGGANYLIVGSDTRSFIKNPADSEAFGNEGDTGGQRSDTMMVLHTDPDSGRALLVSFPRDLWVNIPGRGQSKINAAFNDGPQKIIDTISSNFNVPIQHYVEVNFESFRQIVDAIGTVPVYFPTSARDNLSDLQIPFPGCAELDGPTALAFVRSRHLQLLDPNTKKWEDADLIPDLGRIGRQQAFLREIGAKAMKEALANPFTANKIADRTVHNLTVDQDFGRTDVFVLADGLAGAGDDTDGPESQTVPAEPATKQNQSVLEPTKENDALMNRLRDFTTVVPNPADASPGDTRVRVLNASGVGGAAAAALGHLKKAGFKSGGVADADQPLQNSEIHYPTGKQDEAALLATFVTGPVHVVVDDHVQNADVVLYLGQSFEGIVSGPPPPGSVPVSLAPVPGDC